MLKMHSSQVTPSLDIIKSTYEKILELVDDENKGKCKNVIEQNLEKAKKALDEAFESKRIC